eukprot:TRINITY_DN4031_c0_g1_i1.p1 TRINITY_DN4031_c0_g1~~TRINITY_DN4031_c0_g1_i1.p1  ORF type:complete len:434 (-),score=88.41 TRINITY_DN4031_c0_g1_i1:26-1327(-)
MNEEIKNNNKDKELNNFFLKRPDILKNKKLTHLLKGEGKSQISCILGESSFDSIIKNIDESSKIMVFSTKEKGINFNSKISKNNFTSDKALIYLLSGSLEDHDNNGMKTIDNIYNSIEYTINEHITRTKKKPVLVFSDFENITSLSRSVYKTQREQEISTKQVGVLLSFFTWIQSLVDRQLCHVVFTSKNSQLYSSLVEYEPRFYDSMYVLSIGEFTSEQTKNYLESELKCCLFPPKESNHVYDQIGGNKTDLDQFIFHFKITNNVQVSIDLVLNTKIHHLKQFFRNDHYSYILWDLFKHIDDLNSNTKNQSKTGYFASKDDNNNDDGSGDVVFNKISYVSVEDIRNSDSFKSNWNHIETIFEKENPFINIVHQPTDQMKELSNKDLSSLDKYILPSSTAYFTAFKILSNDDYFKRLMWTKKKSSSANSKRIF